MFCLTFSNVWLLIIFLDQATHISVLPSELIIHLLKWVVSSELDLRSLEQVAMVSRGFYVCCRDVELWKLACMRVWGGDSCGLPSINGYDNWRDMYISRPRLHFNGTYISKTTYVRPGENSFQDSSYQPWHLVTYFRYLRFFPGGLVLMLTTAENPTSIVNFLKMRRVGGRGNTNVLRGSYTLQGDRVRAVFRKKTVPVNANVPRARRKRADVNNNEGSKIDEQIYEMVSFFLVITNDVGLMMLDWFRIWKSDRIRSVCTGRCIGFDTATERNTSAEKRPSRCTTSIRLVSRPYSSPGCAAIRSKVKIL